MAGLVAVEVALQAVLAVQVTRPQLHHRKVITVVLDTPEASPLMAVVAAGQVLLVKAILNMLLAAMELPPLSLARP
jgi:hypothetical protein